MSKIKFGLGALQAAQENYQIILDRLIRGYQKMMKKDPEGLDLIKIKQEARQRADESAKVVDMEGKTLNPDKPIMGGTQQMDEAPKSKVMEAAESFFGPIGKKNDFGEDIRKIYDEAKGPGKGDEMVEALKSPGAIKSSEIIEAQLKETFPDIKLFGDETFEEILEIQKTGKHPRMKADGGRINCALGGPTNIIGAGLMTPGLGSLGGVEEEDEFADIRGQTAGLGLFGPISKGIQSIFGPKIGAAIFENYVRRPSINKGMDAIKKANDIAYAKRLELEEKLATRAALARAQEEINRMGYQDYGSGGASAETMASYEGPDGSYAGASTQDYGSGEKDGGLITMFVEKR